MNRWLINLRCLGDSIILIMYLCFVLLLISVAIFASYLIYDF
jgi:hypothetical protein